MKSQKSNFGVMVRVTFRNRKTHFDSFRVILIIYFGVKPEAQIIVQINVPLNGWVKSYFIIFNLKNSIKNKFQFKFTNIFLLEINFDFVYAKETQKDYNIIVKIKYF